MCICGYRYWTLGVLNAQFNHIDKAFEQYQKALATFQHANDALNTGRLLNHIAELYDFQANPQEKKRLCAEAIDTFWQLKDDSLAIPALSTVAMAHYHQNRPRMALKLLKQVAESCRNMGDLFNEAVTLFYMAQVYNYCKHYSFAIACYSGSVEVLQNSLSLKDCEKAKYFEALNFCHMAQIYQMTRHSDIANQMYSKVSNVFELTDFAEGKWLLLTQQPILLTETD